MAHLGAAKPPPAGVYPKGRSSRLGGGRLGDLRDSSSPAREGCTFLRRGMLKPHN